MDEEDEPMLGHKKPGYKYYLNIAAWLESLEGETIPDQYDAYELGRVVDNFLFTNTKLQSSWN